MEIEVTRVSERCIQTEINDKERERKRKRERER
jgi:hypothetical protein